MKTIEQYLKDNHFTAIEALKGGYCLDGKTGNLYTRLLNAIKEMLKDAYNEGLEDAIKNIEIVNIPGPGNMKRISEHSILKLKK